MKEVTDYARLDRIEKQLVTIDAEDHLSTVEHDDLVWLIAEVKRLADKVWRLTP